MKARCSGPMTSFGSVLWELAPIHLKTLSSANNLNMHPHSHTNRDGWFSFLRCPRQSFDFFFNNFQIPLHLYLYTICTILSKPDHLKFGSWSVLGFGQSFGIILKLIVITCSSCIKLITCKVTDLLIYPKFATWKKIVFWRCKC